MRQTAELFSELDLWPQPWNRFERENTRWRLVPSSDWPAYHHGKLSFDPTHEEANVLYCGFDVEKGFAPIVSEAYPSTRQRKLLVRDSWTWYRFMTDLARGLAYDVVGEVAERTAQLWRLEFRAGYASDPDDFDPQARLGTKIVFEISGTRLSVTGSQREDRRLQPVLSCAKLADLPRCIQAVDELDWIWIDLYFGILVDRRKPGGPTTQHAGLWSSTDLWEKALLPWQGWLT